MTQYELTCKVCGKEFEKLGSLHRHIKQHDLHLAEYYVQFYARRNLLTLTEWVTLPETGHVVTWAWQSTPAPDQPLDRPFAWALIALDGADVPLLHAVDAGSIDAMSTGMAVKVRWAAERGNGITDIACFEPVSDVSGGRS